MKRKIGTFLFTSILLTGLLAGNVGVHFFHIHSDGERLHAHGSESYKSVFSIEEEECSVCSLDIFHFALDCPELTTLVVNKKASFFLEFYTIPLIKFIFYLPSGRAPPVHFLQS